jgi:hypothetical protein
VSVKCPYCQHKMRVKGAHAGRFLPACDRCGDTFMLVVPADPDAPLIVTALDEIRRKLKGKTMHGERG